MTINDYLLEELTRKHITPGEAASVVCAVRDSVAEVMPPDRWNEEVTAYPPGMVLTLRDTCVEEAKNRKLI